MSLRGALAVTRFGLGARQGEINQASRDPKDWLAAQLVTDAAASFPADELMTSQQLIATALEFIRSTRRQQVDEATRRQFRQTTRRNSVSELTARTLLAVTTSYPFHERLVRFWSNHFTVAAKSLPTRLVAGAYEREAIRPNILGSFTDLAMSAIFHPGMLAYLDNWQSIGPNSRTGRRRGRGLNENLAREVLELHTVTPASEYTQDDVAAFAGALTGWSIGNFRIAPDRLGEPIFVDHFHDPGRKRVLSKSYGDQGGEQAKAIVRDLCASPHTANNVAFKLARHFVADQPSASLVQKLSDRFLETQGDLMALYAALVEAEEAWVPQSRKFKTPDELIVSTSRLIGLRKVLVGNPVGVFESFAQIPFTALSPEGWPDEADAWIGPDAILKRIEWANRLAERNSTLDARDLLTTALGERASFDTLQAVMGAESPSQAIALALMSPDFQMR
ncbi:MAG: DUF1800 domain-containing protein [Pseudomonadota bacterium]